MIQLIEVLAEDKPGVLARVTGVIGARGENIARLSASPATAAGTSRIVVSVDMSQAHAEFVRRKLLKMVNVLSAAVRSAEPDAESEFRSALEPDSVRVIACALWPEAQLRKRCAAK
jgi:acetolactate synthase small subunit